MLWRHLYHLDEMWPKEISRGLDLRFLVWTGAQIFDVAAGKKCRLVESWKFFSLPPFLCIFSSVLDKRPVSSFLSRFQFCCGFVERGGGTKDIYFERKKRTRYLLHQKFRNIFAKFFNRFLLNTNFATKYKCILTQRLPNKIGSATKEGQAGQNFLGKKENTGKHVELKMGELKIFVKVEV